MKLFLILTTAFAVSQAAHVCPAGHLKGHSHLTHPAPSLGFEQPSPTAYMNTPELIQHHGYPVETHHFTSQDGYISTWFRIPHGKNGAADKEPVVLCHGVMGSSDDYLLLPPNTGLPFLLADRGHDVWLANMRGNNYSQGHVSLSTDSLRYWDFGPDEIGQHDIPAGFDYVLKNTDRTHGKLCYVGHSMGTTIFFMAMSNDPQLQNKVRKMTALAPVAYLSHMDTPLSGLLTSTVPSPIITTLFKILSRGKVLTTELSTFLSTFGPIICSKEISSNVCESIMYLIAGFSPYTYPKEMTSQILGHTPSDSSAKSIAHLMQWVSRTYLRKLDSMVCNFRLFGDQEPKFQAYDYGCLLNVVHYGTKEPPQYSLGKNLVETMVMYAKNDALVQPEDALRVIYELGNVNKNFTRMIEDPYFNHLDFNYKANARQQCFDNVVEFLSI